MSKINTYISATLDNDRKIQILENEDSPSTGETQKPSREDGTWGRSEKDQENLNKCGLEEGILDRGFARS